MNPTREYAKLKLIPAFLGGLPGFPTGERFHDTVTEEVAMFVGTARMRHAGREMAPSDRIDWLIAVFERHVGHWPKEGLADLRAIYCILFRPADGIEEHTLLRGFTQDDVQGGRCVLSARAAKQPETFLPPADIQRQIEATAERKRA